MMVFQKKPKALILLLGIMGLGAVVVFGLLPLSTKAVDTYQLDLNLTGGDAAVVSELNDKLGLEGEGWEKYYGSFTDDGYLLTTSSLLRLRLGDDFPVEHVEISFKAKGIDNEVESLAGGSKDGQLFNMWSTDPGWCREWDEDCTFNKDCYEGNWGFGIKKWPDMGPHLFSNSILVQGPGLSNGIAVPGNPTGRGNGYDWEAQTGFYTVKLVLHSGQQSSSYLEVTAPNGDPVGNGQSSEIYGLASLADRDGIEATIGAENLGLPSYGGVTIKDVSIYAGREYIPDDRFIWPPPPCPYDVEPSEDVDNPDNPYDTCSCHGIPDVDERPCEDEVDRGDKRKMSFMDPFPFEFDGMYMDWKWELEDIKNEFSQKNEQLAPMPDIAIEFAPPSPQTGDIGAGVAATMNFRSRMQKLFFGWCMIIDGAVYPMNSIVAGGIELPELTEPDLSWDDLGCCQPITRVPEIDEDGDGMDDNWERAKFVDRMGANYNSINDVSPDADPDADGFYANIYENEDGEILSVTPYLIAADQGKTVFSTGDEDAKLTNLEEYILDTDPLNGDSDGDGYGDEMDFMGVGQIQMEFKVEKDPGPEGFYDISVVALGMNQLRMPSFVGAKQRYFVGDEGNLSIAMTASRNVMTFDDNLPITFEVSVVGSEESSEDLFYEWFFNGESACDGVEPDFEELCDEGQMGGVGKRYLTLGEGGISFFDLPVPGLDDTDYSISVRAVSAASRGEDTFELSLPMALPGILVTEDCVDQTENIETLTVNSDEPVFVCISEIEEFSQYDPVNLNFIWTKDGYTDQQQSGSGKTEYALVPTKPVGEEHVVGVVVKDKENSEELINAQRMFPIAGPSIEITEPPTTPIDSSSPEGPRYASFNPGDHVLLEADIKNFDTESGYQITWLVSGQEIDSREMTEVHPVTGWNIPEKAEEGDTYGVTVQVKSLDPENPAQFSDAINLVVGVPPSELGAAHPMLNGLAAVFSKVPKAFQEIMKYASILAAVFFILVFLYPKIARFLDK